MSRIVNEDQEALLRGIVEYPHDEARRLIYSDWLEEHGEEIRAEFIRCQIAKTKFIDGTARHSEMERKCKELFKSAGSLERRRWIAPYNRWFNRRQNFLNTLAESAFDRGFIEQLKFSFAQFAEHGQKLFNHKQPLIRLNLWGSFESLEAFGRNPALMHVRGLGLDALFTPLETFETLFSLPYLNRIEYLRLYNVGLNDRSLESIVRCPACRELEILSAWSNHVTDHGVHQICHAPFAETLRLLNLGGSHEISDTGVRQIAANRRFQNLRRLYLWETRMTDAGFSELITSKHFKLETLYLRSCKLGVDSFRALARSPQASDLRVIDLWLTRNDDRDSSGDDEILELVQSPYLKNLESITLSNRGITNVGADALLQTDAFPKLNWLALSGNRITPDRYKALREKYGTDAVS
jgi:uncharacterized protein (TIGR02996 family)